MLANTITKPFITQPCPTLWGRFLEIIYECPYKLTVHAFAASCQLFHRKTYGDSYSVAITTHSKSDCIVSLADLILLFAPTPKTHFLMSRLSTHAQKMPKRVWMREIYFYLQFDSILIQVLWNSGQVSRYTVHLDSCQP